MFKVNLQHPNSFVTLLSLLFLGLILYFSWEQLLYFCPQGGDYALLGLSVEQAKDWSVLSGPYSRYGFNHPLPTYFYIYAFLEPLVWFSKYWMSKYQLISFIINSLCLIASLQIFRSITKKNIYCVFLILAIAGCFLRTYFIGSWGPSTLPAPLLLLTVSLVALNQFGKAYLPITTISLLLVASNHLIGALIAIALFSWSSIHYLLKGNIKFIFSKHLLFSIIALALALSPVIIDLFKDRELSNPIQVWNYLALNQHANSLQDTIQIFINHFWPKKLDVPLTVFWFLLIWLCIFGAYRKLTVELKQLIQIIVILNIVAIYFAYTLKDEDHSYLFSFYSVAQVLLLTLFLIILEKSIKATSNINSKLFLTFNQSPLASLILSLCLITTITCYYFSRSYQPVNCKLDQIVKKQVSQFKHQTHYQLVMPYLESWNRTALLILELYKNDITICVHPNWEFLFRKSLTCDQQNQLKPYEILKVAPASFNLHANKTGSFIIGRDAFWIEISNELADQSQ